VKIRARIGNQFLKNELLQEVAKAESLLEAGQVLGAMAIITAIADDLQHALNASPSIKVPVNLVLGDLILAEKQLIGLL
jgi:hypothetical protein